MMQAATARGRSDGLTGHEHGGEYLDCLRALSGELEGAMRSIAVNGLASFEASVARQLELCAMLSALAGRHDSLCPDTSVEKRLASDDELGSRIEDAKAKLLRLNRNYSALLNHTKRTVQMFAGLARCYSGYPNSATMGAPNRTWSSEI